MIKNGGIQKANLQALQTFCLFCLCGILNKLGFNYCVEGPGSLRPAPRSLRQDSAVILTAKIYYSERIIKSKISKEKRSKGQSPEETKHIFPRVLSPRSHIGCT